MIIGLISDTHGLLRKEVIDNLIDCDLIIHSGDVGKLEIIDNLRSIAETKFVRGNVDMKNSDFKFSIDEEIVEINNKKLYVIHDIKELNRDLESEEIDIVIYGHSHKKNIESKNGIIYINPGSVGPKRFKLPINMAKLYIKDNNKEYIGLINQKLENDSEKEVFEFEDYIIQFINLEN